MFPAIHALATTAREIITHRAEAVSDLIESAREYIDTAARVDLVSLTLSRLVSRVARIETADRDTQSSFDRIRSVLLSHQQRLDALAKRSAGPVTIEKLTVDARDPESAAALERLFAAQVARLEARIVELERGADREGR